MKPKLSAPILCDEAGEFSRVVSNSPEPSLYGVTDGKAVGTHLEHNFRAYLSGKFDYEEGSSARGIDFPLISVDMKVTSIKQPQSSCPFKSARQKIYGLGYSLLIFVYEKTDDHESRSGTLNILHNIYLQAHRTGDYQITRGIRSILENEGNKDDLMAFMFEKNLPVEEIEAESIADEILRNPPEQGFLTISNALQWRLQYRRIIETAGNEEGIIRIR